MTDSEALAVLYHFYPEDNLLRQTLLHHSLQVREKALAILKKNSDLHLNAELVSAGSILHDIGIRCCHAPDIHCTGTRHYLEHGIAGAEMLRSLNPAMEPFARICECHTGSGLTAEEIRSGNLPLPHRDFLPSTQEEKLICLADKFFSKSGDMQEKSLERIRKSMSRFGTAPLTRFDELCRSFKI